VKGTKRGLAMALDGNGRWCYLDPKQGAKLAVAEAARKVACTGAVPVAATNCLNFGNPEKPEIMAQLSAAIDGIAEACTALGTPITGGNVSLYNETKGEGIYPTPVIGIVGILEDVSKAVPSSFQQMGDAVVLICPLQPTKSIKNSEGKVIHSGTGRDFGSTEYMKEILGSAWGTPPEIDLAAEKNLQLLLIELTNNGLIRSARDLSDGFAVSLAEACFEKQIGAQAELEYAPPFYDQPELLFEESATRILVSCEPRLVPAIQQASERAGLEAIEVGRTVQDRLTVSIANAPLIQSTVADLKSAWSNALQSTLSVDTVTA
jgi:phosphoribosylformylglycinamidine (FGAM) synthase-like enzyme